MGDSPLFTLLKKLDPNLAKVYFDITKDDPKAVIQADDVDTLFLQALDKDKTITSKELDALIAIIQGVPFTKEAQARELLIITDSSVAEALGRGVGTLLKTPDDLAEVTRALDMAALHVDFKSPGTHLTYNAADYSAMKALVLGGDIIVISLNDHGVVFGNVRPQGAPAQGAAAAYDVKTDPPTVFLFDGVPALGKGSLIAHEFTHGVQDWSNNQSPRKYHEADAYIVQGLTFMAETSRPIPDKHPVKACVDIIVAGKATNANKDWGKAYEDFANLVAGDPLNAQPSPSVLKGGEKKKKLAKLLQAAQKAAQKSAPAAPKPAPPAPPTTKH